MKSYLLAGVVVMIDLSSLLLLLAVGVLTRSRNHNTPYADVTN